MIAAQALIHRAALVTVNAGDYADIPELALLAWWAAENDFINSAGSATKF